jgi:galactose mutarotase-like enzyme
MAEGNSVVMTHVSEDGWENYPGTVMANVRMEMDNENNFTVSITATSDQPTPINLGNHSYFNLAGHVSLYFQVNSNILKYLSMTVCRTRRTLQAHRHIER